MARQVVKVKRETLQACMTCPLCHNLFNDATTISLCLHTFCKKCIYEKLSDEESDCCPVCNIDLGCLPVEKLRPDHNLQDIRAKIFPYKRRKIKVPEVVPSVSLPAKRKERSLSSLVITAPKVPIQTGFTGKRTKTGTRKAAALRGCNFTVEEPIKKEETCAEDNPDSSIAERSKKNKPNEDTENNVELTEGKVDLWTPLNCLVEAANRTKSSKLNSQGLSLTKLEPPTSLNGGSNMPEVTTKSEPPATVHNELRMPKTKNKDNGQKTKFGDDKDGNILPPGQVRRRRVRPAGQKRAAASEISASAQVMVDATRDRCNRKNSPIWFSLVASEDQKGDVPLPQISACYLRIKDGTVPVSFIQKYLVKKLNLASEAEVEIMCRGRPVLPSLQLHNLVDLWFRTASTSKKIPASVGSSAKDFVMVLSYCRKALAP
ncbi:E3 ubiquitin protein ligase DRIP2-like isoform X1 [Senna tora]|uniref:E3 ubiquitin protein ligase DRIP2-like isoform X1 n=1 Tax=Senna tora TaxID=362788 RepID=A0A834TAS6_9FABA|nr:E3 ubiquitin protein ligase DRIP2-like isoform X1 [Senna tora]